MEPAAEQNLLEVFTICVAIPLVTTVGSLILKKAIIRGYVTMFSDLFLAVFILDITQLVVTPDQPTNMRLLWALLLLISFLLWAISVSMEGILVRNHSISFNDSLIFDEDAMPWWTKRGSRVTLILLLNILVGANLGILYV